MAHRHALAAVALVNVLALSSVARADEPPPPPPPKPAAGPVTSDMQPSTPPSVAPLSADPVPQRGPMMHHGHDHGEGEEHGPQATVTLSSDRAHAMLFRSTTTGYVAAGAGAPTMTHVRTFVPVCVAPCTIATDANATYRIGGEGVALSDEFHLPTGQGTNVDLKVHGGSLAARKGGGALIGGGITALVAGGALLIAGYASRPDYTDPKYLGEPRYLKSELDSSRSVRTAGFIVAPIGALFVLTGAILSAIGRTTVETGSTKLASTEPPKPSTKLTLDGLGVTF